MRGLEEAFKAFSAQRFQEAETLLSGWITRFPNDKRALELRFRTLSNLDRFEDAERVLLKLASLDGTHPEYRFYLGVLYLHLGRLKEARAQLLLSNALAPANSLCLLNLGLVAYQLGSFREAAAVLREARQHAPKLLVAAIYEARSLIELSEMEEAKACLPGPDAVTNLPPEQANEYALAAISLGLLVQAELALTAAVADNPDFSPLSVNLAHVYERLNRIEESARLLEHASSLDPFGRLLLARVKARQGKADQALEEIEKLRIELGEAAEDEDLGAQMEFDRGRLLEKLGEHDAAFKAYSKGNQIDRAAFVKRRPDLPVVGGLPALASVVTTSTRVVRSPRGIDLHAPIFLVGFPRSGTTLLDQILDAHPEVQVLEEKPMVEVVVRALGRTLGSYPDCLGRIDDAVAERARAVYWGEVERHTTRNPGQRFVDKNPFNLCRLPLIDRLFPGAQYIFSIRHPLDCILSCFINRFRYTQYSHGFWDLEEIAGIYRDSIGFWLTMRERLPIQCFDLRYEDLVENTEDLARGLLRFIGVPWDARVLEYHRHARTRLISTPSYDQVVQPIYRDSLERWRFFADHLQGAIGIVKPWVEQLGYRC